MERENNELKILGALTNLHAYNCGELRYEWVQFPCSPETLQEALDNIGIGEEDEYGVSEEWFFSDFDCYAPSQVYHELGEYTSIEKLQIVGEILERINEMGDNAIAMLEGLMENFDFMDAAYNVLNNRAYLIKGIDNVYDLGEFVYNEYYNEGQDFPKDKAEMYFDYETFGRHMRDEHNAYNEDTINEYLGLDDNADDYEIGEAYIDQILGSLSEVTNINEYVDFEAYGRDLDIEGEYIWLNDGVIDYGDCEELGDELYEDIKSDLINKGIIADYSKNTISCENEER